MYPDAYIDYLVYFHGDRDLFECHEILEDYWKQLKAEEKSEIWVSLIQLAVGLYHERRGNRIGARKMLSSALFKLQEHDLEPLGLAKDELITQLEQRIANLTKDQAQPFTDFNLPLQSPELLTACMLRADERNVTWLAQSNMADAFLINKHTLRSRDNIIQTRLDALLKRRNEEK